MESKWPLMAIAFGLVFLLGLVISGLERTKVIKNWEKRRCEIAVMAAAGFFKEDSDSRSRTQFAKDNFEFCMKTYVDKFVAILLAPVTLFFDKQANLASSSMGAIDMLRSMAQTMYEALTSAMEGFYRRFNTSVFQMSRIVQFMRMAMRRVNAMMMSMLYSGLTLFRGMINTIQFVIKVVLIICGIMIAILIVLWFVLFPVIPLIISTLGAIVATVLMMSMIISGQIADQANASKKGFCFASDSLIPIMKDGKEYLVSIGDIKVGDQLANDAGTVTAVIEMDGTDVPLFEVKGIHVSGSHLIQGTDGIWKSVEEDERANPLSTISPTLYCFNTTSHNIPVYSPILSSKTGTRVSLMFRDWEEFYDQDEKGHYAWNYLILSLLNEYSHYDKWKDSVTPSTEVPLLSGNRKVKTRKGYISLSKLVVGYDEIVDRKGRTQKVVGKVYGEVEGEKKESWNTELFELRDDVWIKGESNVGNGTTSHIGQNIITEMGEFVIWDEEERRERVVRDFTDIGYKAIHQTYPLVASRLRIFDGFGKNI